MPSSRRLLAWLGGVTVLAGAVVALRVTDNPPSPTPPLRRYAADSVILPQPSSAPAAPRELTITPGPGRLGLAWVGDARAVGYEVSWQARSRLVIVPETQLDSLTDGQIYQVRVRAVDAFGQHSPTVTASGVPGRDDSWRAGLTGVVDDFTDPKTVRTDLPGSLWHLSGYRPCDERGLLDGNGLALDLGCGADLAVVRARQPLRLADPPGADGVLGRVVVVTDAAGPGGSLTVDLTSGPADRMPGARVLPAPMPDSTIRVVINDAGAQLDSAAEVPGVTGSAGVPARAPPRGPGVLHRFEIVLTLSGVRVTQDGTLISVDGVRPPWRQASVLLGLRGPENQRVRVHLAAAGFSGPAEPLPPVVETALDPVTPKVLGPTEPMGGPPTGELHGVRSARAVATITTSPALDVNRIVMQLGDRTFPAHPVTPGLPTPPGPVTIAADLPVDLPTLTPFVVRTTGAGAGVSVLESYLELTPGPGWTPQPPRVARNIDPRRPAPDSMPIVDLTLGNAAGAPLTSTEIAGQGQLVLTVSLDPSAAQWAGTGIAGVAGFALLLDGGMVASLPTDGPALGGRYVVSLALGGLHVGPHVLEVREIGYTRVASVLRDFDLR